MSINGTSEITGAQAFAVLLAQAEEALRHARVCAEKARLDANAAERVADGYESDLEMLREFGARQGYTAIPAPVGSPTLDWGEGRAGERPAVSASLLGRVSMGDAIDKILGHSDVPLTSRQILTALAELGPSLTNGVPNFNTLRSYLSKHKGARGWVLNGQARGARWTAARPGGSTSTAGSDGPHGEVAA